MGLPGPERGYLYDAIKAYIQDYFGDNLKEFLELLRRSRPFKGLDFLRKHWSPDGTIVFFFRFYSFLMKKYSFETMFFIGKIYL